MGNKRNNTGKSALLFDQSKATDSKALEKLFHRLFPRLLDFALKITKENQIVEDIIQKVFVQV